MKKDIEWLRKEFDEVVEFRKQSNPSTSWALGSNAVLKCIKEDFKNLINQLDEPDSDYAYQKGFREGERQTAEYFESVTEEPSYAQVQKYLSEHGIKIADKEPETVADVVTTFWKSFERLKEVMSMEVEEMEE